MTNLGEKPRMSVGTCSLVCVGLIGCCDLSLKTITTYGQWGRYFRRVLRFVWIGISRRVFKRSFFSFLSTGGKSGETFNAESTEGRFLAFPSHASRWAKSLKRAIMLEFAELWFKRWQAVKCILSASCTPISLASLRHFSRVIASFSPASPGNPLITSDHLRECTSISSNICASAIEEWFIC